MKNLIKKAYQTYKEEGVEGVKKKSIAKVRHLRGDTQESSAEEFSSLEEKALYEEYNFVSSPLFQITGRDIRRSKDTSGGSLPAKIETATWFVPSFEHWFAGVQTMFRFMERLSIEGVKNTIVIYDNPALNADTLREQINQRFSRFKNFEIVVFTADQEKGIEDLPPSDIAFCTLWVSAYALLRYNKTKRKYYFIQDYEAGFYVAGSCSALAESTYRFGFTGIVNTPGLYEAVHERHGIEGVSFVPAVDTTLYHPDPAKNNKRVRIFLYARPFNPRNAFNLGIVTIKMLLDKYGNKIEIITAGAEWDEAKFGLQGKITNLNLIKSLDDVAALYRSCDIGFSFMLTKHTSYQLLEYVASGMATVINRNEDHLWLHKDGKNCLLSEPSPAAMAESIGKLVDSPALRKKIARGGEDLLKNTWDKQTKLVWNYITSGKK
jgi:glycosyltransferase involved in cell wall biosynthesis